MGQGLIQGGGVKQARQVVIREGSNGSSSGGGGGGEMKYLLADRDRNVGAESECISFKC